MSHLVHEWAEDDAPVANVHERVILMVLAGRADDDGTGAYAQLSTMATAAACDPQTVRRCLEAMMTRGLSALGDQQQVTHIAAGHRPQVYDLLVPITSDNRPSLAGEVSQ